MHYFSLPVTEKTKALFSQAKTDHFRLGTLSEFLDLAEKVPANVHTKEGCGSTWSGGLPWKTTMGFCHNGDLSSVAKSDKLLSKLDMFPAPTARHTWIDDVTGAFPNVPAYLAGQPLNMRRKVKQDNEFQPLAVVVNLLSSASVKASDVHARGIAILALVRALTAKRPVELWVGVTSQGKTSSESASVYFRIETAPLDLARAAHLISHPSISRALAYSILYDKFEVPSGIPFAYGAGMRGDDAQKVFHQTIAHAFPHMSDVLAIPMLHGADQTVSDPVAWIQEKVRHYGADALADEAA